MFKIIKTVTLAMLTLSSFSSFAVNTGLVTQTKITRLEAWAGGGYFVMTDKPIVNPAGCKITDKYVLEKSSSNELKSLLLAATSAEFKIDLQIYGVKDACNTDRPIIVMASIVK